MNNEYFTKPVRNAVLAFLIVGSLFLAAKTIAAVRSLPYKNATDQIPNISVTGKGEVFAVPDIGTFTFSVIEEAKTVKEAQTKAADRNNKAIEYLKKAGVVEKDIKTVAYNVNPQYDYNTKIACIQYPCTSNPVLVGYQAVISIQVKVRDTAKAGELLAGVGSLGVQNMSGLDFTIDDDAVVIREARQKAIEDAKTQANVLAKDLGVRLVRIVSFQESGSYPPIFYSKLQEQRAGAADTAANAPELPTGENKITSNVTITYEIR